MWIKIVYWIYQIRSFDDIIAEKIEKWVVGRGELNSLERIYKFWERL